MRHGGGSNKSRVVCSHHHQQQEWLYRTVAAHTTRHGARDRCQDKEISCPDKYAFAWMEGKGGGLLKASPRLGNLGEKAIKISRHHTITTFYQHGSLLFMAWLRVAQNHDVHILSTFSAKKNWDNLTHKLCTCMCVKYIHHVQKLINLVHVCFPKKML